MKQIDNRQKQVVQARSQKVQKGFHGVKDKHESHAPDYAGSELGDSAKKPKPIVNTEPKMGRNDPCSCGSGKKYKKCCLDKA